MFSIEELDQISFRWLDGVDVAEQDGSIACIEYCMSSDLNLFATELVQGMTVDQLGDHTSIGASHHAPDDAAKATNNDEISNK
jgi:hypothetical protein